MKDVDRRFREFHRHNPRVYDELVALALQAKRQGKRKVGIKMLLEIVRWYRYLERDGDDFKVNNDFAPHYARLMMLQEPELTGFFDTRRAKGDPE